MRTYCTFTIYSAWGDPILSVHPHLLPPPTLPPKQSLPIKDADLRRYRFFPGQIDATLSPLHFHTSFQSYLPTPLSHQTMTKEKCLPHLAVSRNIIVQMEKTPDGRPNVTTQIHVCLCWITEHLWTSVSSSVKWRWCCSLITELRWDLLEETHVEIPWGHNLCVSIRVTVCLNPPSYSVFPLTC